MKHTEEYAKTSHVLFAVQVNVVFAEEQLAHQTQRGLTSAVRNLFTIPKIKLTVVTLLQLRVSDHQNVLNMEEYVKMICVQSAVLLNAPPVVTALLMIVVVAVMEQFQREVNNVH